jgi:5-oxopent-3-ene-1,2,5-tricarboxylate decarboxylase/2-hydroxyhepta-2,4-diene-1,7-dioate isomerase
MNWAFANSIRTVYTAVLNDRATLDALGDTLFQEPYKKPPVAPVLMIKPPNTWIGHGDPIPCPAGVAQLRMGGTLAVIIGRTATRVSAEDALRFVAGYTIANDVSIPHKSYYRPPIAQRCRDGFCPIGPAPVNADALADPNRLPIRISINDEVLWTASTANLLRPVPALIADITEFMTLHEGDLLLVGEPFGAPLAAPGDRVRVEIDGIGALENTIVAEAA